MQRVKLIYNPGPLIYGIPLNSDREWSPFAHWIYVAMEEHVNTCAYKTFWTELFYRFRYLRYGYMAKNLSPEQRSALRKKSWSNFVARLKSKESGQASIKDIPAERLPKFDPTVRDGYVELAIHELVLDARTMLRPLLPKLLPDVKTHKELDWVLGQFKAELIRDFETILLGKAPGPPYERRDEEEDGDEGEGETTIMVQQGAEAINRSLQKEYATSQAEQELIDGMKVLPSTLEDDLEDVERLMGKLNLEEEKGKKFVLPFRPMQHASPVLPASPVTPTRWILPAQPTS